MAYINIVALVERFVSAQVYSFRELLSLRTFANPMDVITMTYSLNIQQ
jgi:hypothetical protein